MRPTDVKEGIAATQTALLINIALIVFKLISGVLGNSYALIADAVESGADLVASLIVWGGLKVSGKPADSTYPYGYGKAETVAAGAVALLLIGAAGAIAVAAVREIVTPHHAPEPFTLAVLVIVVLVKESLYRQLARTADRVNSAALNTDAWHHRGDALTSLAAFVGILVAIVNGPGWESADDWAALVAAVVIALNGYRLLKPSLDELMDRAPGGPVAATLEQAARGVEGVLAIEKLRIRKLGPAYFVDVHVQADPGLSLRDAHVLSGKVKSALKQSLPFVQDTSIHMEPFERKGPA